MESSWPSEGEAPKRSWGLGMEALVMEVGRRAVGGGPLRLAREEFCTEDGVARQEGAGRGTKKNGNETHL